MIMSTRMIYTSIVTYHSNCQLGNPQISQHFNLLHLILQELIGQYQRLLLLRMGALACRGERGLKRGCGNENLLEFNKGLNDVT